jgi:hypothetical protein
MQFARRIIKARTQNTHSYLLFIASARQQRLRERASISRYAYTAQLV